MKGPIGTLAPQSSIAIHILLINQAQSSAKTVSQQNCLFAAKCQSLAAKPQFTYLVDPDCLYISMVNLYISMVDVGSFY